MPQSLHCSTLCDDDDIDDDEDHEYVIDNEKEEDWNEVCEHTGE